MEYIDRIYGKTEINDPAVLELVGCPTIQRLKKIDQAGYFTPFYPGTEQSRFEHSVGVYLLLKNYGAPIEEQIAGLIHDASHSAFSHCVDYVLAAGSESEQSHQDNVFDEFVRRSEILSILKKYSIDPEYILDQTNFPLEETDLPDLCADRIDYSLRTARVFGEIESADYFLENLEAEKQKWVFKDFESAKGFAKMFFKMNARYYSGLFSAVMFRAVGDYLRYALEKGYINEADLYSTDEEALAKIARFHDKDGELSKLFDRMNNKIGFRNDPADYDVLVACKSRAVDPLFRADGIIKRVSEADGEWKKILEAESKPKIYFIKFDK
ncbi:MAG: hypothetical protein L7H18_00455 [Candidatus Nealsonbacteria bacterium DGGOD1a]|nr:MAG: hypothetical protein L7H18_00455 [Candidatus Nealsonbacteria bacterium DGGOD1a]